MHSLRFDRALLHLGPLAAEVAVAFSHAVLARVFPDGPLLTLLHPDRDLVPLGVCGPASDLASLEVGDELRLEGRSLWIGRGSRWDLAGDGVSLRLPDLPFSRESLASQLPTVAAHRRQDRSALEQRALAKADALLRHLVLDLSGARVLAGGVGVAPAVSGLIGTGFGSTPTGDDWLVGVVALGHRMSQAGLLYRPSWEELLAALLEAGPEATTPVAREMLRHAAVRELPEALLRVAGLLGQSQARPDDLDAACGRLLTVGARSGSDLLTGVLALAGAVCAAH